MASYQQEDISKLVSQSLSRVAPFALHSTYLSDFFAQKIHEVLMSLERINRRLKYRIALSALDQKKLVMYKTNLEHT